MTKACAYDVNECCVRLEVGDWNVRWAGVSDRCWIRESCCWIRESSLLDTWEFVSGSEQIRWAEVSKIGERNWAESVSGTEQNRWAELMRERQWRVVSKREVDPCDVAWCRTWRGVRLNVAERAVERGGVCGWTEERDDSVTSDLNHWALFYSLCFTVVDSIVCECDVLLLWSDWREKNRYAVKLLKLQR